MMKEPLLLLMMTMNDNVGQGRLPRIGSGPTESVTRRASVDPIVFGDVAWRQQMEMKRDY
jgi:hypothetical protein